MSVVNSDHHLQEINWTLRRRQQHKHEGSDWVERREGKTIGEFVLLLTNKGYVTNKVNG